MHYAMEQELYKYFRLMSEAEKESVLQLIKTFVKAKESSWERTSLQQYNQELQEAEKAIETGNYTTQEDLEQEVKKW